MTFYYLCLISDGSSLTIHVTKNPLWQLAKQRETASRRLVMTYNLRFQEKRKPSHSKNGFERGIEPILVPMDAM